MSERHDHPQLSALLRETQWLKRLALSLASDQHDADDVVQDVWVSALRKPPGFGNLRAWLRAAATSAVLKKRRGEERRQRREAAVARDRVTQTTSDQGLVRRAELHKLIVSAVVDLRDPYRMAILRRYFDELSVAEIADLEGVPVETIRSRLKRGLGLLRAQLDRESGGDRDAWTAPLLAAFGGVRAAASSLPAAASSSTVAALAWKAAVVVVLVVGGVLLAVRGRSVPGPSDPRDPPATEHRIVTPAPVVAGADTKAEAPAEDVSQPRRATDAPACGLVTGRLVTREGTSVAGVRVRALALPEAMASGAVRPLRVLADATSGSDGRFSLGPFRDTVLLEILPRVEARVVEPVDPDSDRTWVLVPAGELALTVRDLADGTPLTGAAVLLRAADGICFRNGFTPAGAPRRFALVSAHAKGSTDAEGRCRLANLAPGAYQLALYPRDRRWMCTRGYAVVIRAGACTSKSYGLTSDLGVAVHGTVTADRPDRPVAGARVVVVENPWNRTETDARGRFTLDGLADRARLQVHAPGFLPAIRVLPALTATTIRMGIALDRPAVVRCRVVNERGEPVAGARVARRPAPLLEPPAPSDERTDATGWIRLDHARPGPSVRWYAIADGYGLSVSAPVAVTAGEEGTATIRLRCGGEVDLAFAASSDRSSGCRAVCLVAQDPGASRVAQMAYRGRTDPDGRFRMGSILPGRYRVAAWIDRQVHWFATTLAVAPGSVTAARFDTGFGHRLSGRVVDRRGGPVAGVKIRAWPVPADPPTDRADLAVTDGDGRFQFQALRAGRYRLDVAPDARLASADPVDAATGQRDVVISLRRRIVLTGRVRHDLGGTAVRSFYVRVFRYGREDPELSRKRAFVHPRGAFRLALPLPEGTYAVEAVCGDRVSPRPVPFLVAPGHPLRPVRLGLVRGGRLAGRVVTKTGGFAAGAEIRVVPRGADAKVLRFRADDRGVFQSPVLPPAVHGVEVRHGDALGWSEVEVTADTTARVEITTHVVNRLVVRVLDPVGRVVDGAAVTLDPDGRGSWWQRRHGRTGAEGACLFRALRPGTYEINVSQPGFTAVRDTVVVGLAGIHRRDLRLMPPGDSGAPPGKRTGKR